MKKLLALVLALVMVMALAVSAFAVELVKDKDDDDEDLTELVLADDTKDKVVEVANFEDKEYAIFVKNKNDDGTKMKNITAEGTGIVKDVKVVDLDPKVYNTEKANIKYYVATKAAPEISVNNLYNLTYDEACEEAKALNKAEKTTKYVVKCHEDIKVVLFTIAGNTGVAYADGKLTIKATDKDGNKYSKKYTFVNDVTLFKYEEVKAAGEYEQELYCQGTEGYSDYKVAQNGGRYIDPEQGGDIEARRGWTSVIPTTAFRAVAGEELVVVSMGYEGTEKITVTIPEVAAGQKGVNFASYVDEEFVDDDEDGEKDDNEPTTALEFGFYGKQVIASDYTIEYDTGYNYFELRERFGKKLEEEDIVTFFITKDGKAFDKFTVDYMTVDYTDPVEIVINGKAGTTLGEYAITLTAPAGESEENPNTGAESAVAVVAAMAVVSAVAAAAVTLKK